MHLLALMAAVAHSCWYSLTAVAGRAKVYPDAEPFLAFSANLKPERWRKFGVVSMSQVSIGIAIVSKAISALHFKYAGWRTAYGNIHVYASFKRCQAAVMAVMSSMRTSCLNQPEGCCMLTSDLQLCCSQRIRNECASLVAKVCCLDASRHLMPANSSALICSCIVRPRVWQLAVSAMPTGLHAWDERLLSLHGMCWSTDRR